MCEEHYLNGGKSIQGSSSASSRPNTYQHFSGNSNTQTVYRQVHHESVNADTNHHYGESFAENPLIMDDFNVSDGEFDCLYL